MSPTIGVRASPAAELQTSRHRDVAKGVVHSGAVQPRELLATPSPGSASGRRVERAQSSASLPGPSRVIRRVSSPLGTVAMSSRFSAQSSGIPSSRPSTTSVGIPRTVRVAGATITWVEDRERGLSGEDARRPPSGLRVLEAPDLARFNVRPRARRRRSVVRSSGGEEVILRLADLALGGSAGRARLGGRRSGSR